MGFVASANTFDVDVMAVLLDRIVDSVDVLEVVVHLYRIQPAALPARSIARALQLAPENVASALAKLQRAGIVRSDRHDDDGGWSFDARAAWAPSIDVLVNLYDLDRAELLTIMKHIGFQRFRMRDAGAAWPVLTRKRRGKQELPN